MSIKFACSCGKAYKVPEKFSGKRVKCKNCGEPIRVPSQSQTGVHSQRAAAVSQRRVMSSDRVDKKKSRRASRRSSSSSSSATRSRSGRSKRVEKEAPAPKSRKSGRSKRSKPGSGTERFEAIDLTNGNERKIYQRKKQTDEEEFDRGEGRLTYYENGKAVKAFRLGKGEVLIGRGESCKITLPLASISREHARLEYMLGVFILTDLGSKNGVVVDGRTVRRISLKNGNVIQFGQAVLRIDC